MSSSIFNAEIDLSSFNPVFATYQSANVSIHTQAIQVTKDNVGRLCLEFEAELYYSEGRPYFTFMAERGTDLHPENPRSLVVRVGDWILPLRGELHVFDDFTFNTTFRVDHHPSQKRPPSTPPVDWENSPGFALIPTESKPQPGAITGEQLLTHRETYRKFDVDDRVKIRDTGDYGKVVVTNVDRGDGTSGYEVELESTGQKYVFGEEDLELQYIPDHIAITHQKGVITGPEGTGIMPRVVE